MSEISRPDWTTSGESGSPDRMEKIYYKSVAKEQDVSPFKFLTDACNYTGGFRDGLYLIPFPIEGYYDQRRDYSNYTNFFAPIINAMITPVFSKDAVRKIVSESGDDIQNDIFDKFLEDCDGRGNSLHKFIKENAAKYGRVHSKCFIVVDNFPEEAQPETLDISLKNRIFPYVYLKKLTQVGRWENDNFGKLLSISFADKEVMIKESKRMLYKMWTDTYSVLEYKDEDGKWVQFEEPRYHYLGVVPVAIFGDSQPEDPAEIAPNPKMYGIGRICHAIFNKDSEMRHIERVCMFPMLAVQGNGESIGGAAGSIMYYPDTSTNQPQWIQPDAAMMTVLRENRNGLRDDMFAMVEQLGVMAKKTSLSGVALAYEFQAHAHVLNETANFCEDGERQIMDIFFRYMVWQGMYYEVEYNREYLPYDTKESIDHDGFLVDTLGVPQGFKDDLLRDHYKRRFPDAENDRIEEIVAEGLIEKEDMVNAVRTDWGNRDAVDAE